ncbi:MAG: RtcB family protein [bacterium]
MFEIKGKYTTAKIMIDNVEPECVTQITSFINHPAFTNPVAIMPDTHAGKGSVIGFTMPMGDKIIPNTIGVDINCGVLSFNIGKEIPMSKKELEHKIRTRIPMGMNYHKKSMLNMKTDFPWKEVKADAHNFMIAYNKKFGFKISPPDYSMSWFEDKCKDIGISLNRALTSLGTLGGGNHFIEIGKDLNDNYWVTIHSGSRNFGKCICEYWQNIATKKVKYDHSDKKLLEIEEAKSTLSGRDLYNRIKEIKEKYNYKININGLEYLEGSDASGYFFDMIFAQKYADVNRQIMAKIILDILKIDAIDWIETKHNFIDFKDMTIRKGAIRSYIGERFVLPFNMRDGILICEGLSNSEWNCSAPHGAGRIMSRSKAKKTIDIETFKEQMKNVYSTSVCVSTLDEAPDAYKDSSIIEEAIKPTAKILNRIIPIINLKSC